jgi:CRP-like cAMP-binding protein
MNHLSNKLNPIDLQMSGNRLIDGLSLAIRTRLLQHCKTVEITFGEILCEPQELLRYAFFPLTGFISLLTLVEDHQPLEICLIGNEGMMGATLSLSVSAAPMRALVQGSGHALRISAAQLRRELNDSPELMAQLHRYVYVVLEQLAKTAACIHFHDVAQRLARWLLMTHDRTHSDQLHLTQEFLADMLGVRRSSITLAAGVLQNGKLIHYNRGEIIIVDRKGLEKIACECYQTLKQDYELVFA